MGNGKQNDSQINRQRTLASSCHGPGVLLFGKGKGRTRNKIMTAKRGISGESDGCYLQSGRQCVEIVAGFAGSGVEHSQKPDAKKRKDGATPDSSIPAMKPASGKSLEDKADDRQNPAPEADHADYCPTLVDHFPPLPKKLPNSEPSFSFQTMITASRTIFLDIFEVPACRSMKIIGTSPILNPFSMHR